MPAGPATGCPGGTAGPPAVVRPGDRVLADLLGQQPGPPYIRPAVGPSPAAERAGAVVDREEASRPVGDAARVLTRGEARVLLRVQDLGAHHDGFGVG